MKVSIVAVTTIDGFIAKSSDHAADWSSREDKKLFVELTKRAGVMIMGSTTFDTIGRALPERKTVVYTTKPDTYAEFDITTTDAEPVEILRQLAEEGFSEVAICGGSHIYDLFLKAGLVTDIYIAVEPYIFGTGISLFTSDYFLELELVSSESLGEHGLNNHYIVKSVA